MTSQLNVDTIVDKAGSGGTNVKIANTSVTVSEGGSGTTNTVQGLTKVWIAYGLNTGNVVVVDSFNVSGTTDNAAGDTTYAFSNNMATAKGYTVSGKMSPDGDTTAFVYSPQPLADDHVLTSSLRITTNYAGASAANSGDYPYNSNNVHGDLA